LGELSRSVRGGNVCLYNTILVIDEIIWVCHKSCSYDIIFAVFLREICSKKDLDGDKMKVTKEDMENVAVLSRLEIPAEKEAQYTQQLNDFLEYVENLSTVPTDDIQPIAHVLPISNVFRDDVVKKSIDRDLALSNAPLKEDGYFKVPKVLED